MKRMRRIMHATDFSSASSRALAKAVELAKQNKAELLLVHVLAAIIPYDPGDGYAAPGPVVTGGAGAESQKGEGKGEQPSAQRDGARSDRSGREESPRRLDRHRNPRAHRHYQVIHGQCRRASGVHGFLPGDDGSGKVTMLNC